MEIQENPQESIGKRYAYLSNNFHEITTLAVENENMYAYAHSCLTKLVKDIQEMKKQCCYSNLGGRTDTKEETLVDANLQSENVPQVDDSVTLRAVRGIKTKTTIGRPRNRLKDPLEQRRKHKSQSKATQVYFR